MVAQVLLIALSLIGLTLSNHLQDTRQVLYQRQQQPARQYVASQYHQQPAPTHLLPNNVNDGVRYGQQSVVYVVPQGSQFLYEEAAGQPQSGAAEGAFVESFMNLVNSPSGYYQAASDSKPVQQQPPFAGAEKPERLQSERLQPEQFQGERLQAEQPSFTSQAAQQQQYLQQLAAQEQMQYLQQEAQRQKLMALSAQPQYFQRPSAAAPHNLFYYSFPQQQLQQYPQADRTAVRPNHQTFGFQKLVLRSGQEQNNASSELGGEESQEESQTPTTQEEIGPSIAQAKPQAISVAGPGGVAAAAPVGTAVVGPGGMALSAPSATALAGTKPKPGQQPGQGAKLRQALRYAY